MPDPKTAFATALTALAEEYGKQMSPARMKLWWKILGHHPMEQVSQAILAHISDPERGRFMPHPADILAHLNGNPADNAALAWAEVIRAIGAIGPYESVCFDDQQTMKAIQDMGGWIKLCKITENEAPFRQKDFESLHRAHLNTSRCIDYLPGIAERDCLSGNHPEHVPEVRRIGGGKQQGITHEPAIQIEN